MKIFISWSGEFSQQIAEKLRVWLPRFIQQLEVFVSSEDIEKGEGWEKRLNNELSECSYGIVCLTPENVDAPWLHFESGAISKSFDSRVYTLMININTSDIKGPLKSFQATSIKKEDFARLLFSINKNLELSLNDATLQGLFDVLWDSFNIEMNEIIKSYATSVSDGSKKGKKVDNNEALEEILQLLRNQNALLLNPEKLFPREYITYINNTHSTKQKDYGSDEIIEVISLALRLVDRAVEFGPDFKTRNKQLIEQLLMLSKKVLFSFNDNRIHTRKYNSIEQRIYNIQNNLLNEICTENNQYSENNEEKIDYKNSSKKLLS